jgi:tripartite-type tricarboxylate transporter receptor subunit TctC
VVENQPGASTAIAATTVARAAPDGYTLLIGASSTMTINPVLYPNLAYSPERDLRPVTIMGSFPLILAVNPSLPVTTVRELVDYSRRSDRQLNYSTASVAFQLATEMFKQMSGANLYHVPYKGSSQAMLAVLSGDVQVVILDGAPLVPHMQSGRLRALAVTSATRSPLYPSLPAVSESGVPDYQVELWIGLFAPARTPVEIVARLQGEIARIMQRTEVREKFARLGIEARGDSTEQTAAMIRAEAVRFAAIIRAAGIKPE